MSKFQVTVYQETYTTVIVEAEDKSEARDKALMGEHEFIDDVIVQGEDIESVERYEDS